MLGSIKKFLQFLNIISRKPEPTSKMDTNGYSNGASNESNGHTASSSGNGNCLFPYDIGHGKIPPTELLKLNAAMDIQID
jgi:hypothetical protein